MRKWAIVLLAAIAIAGAGIWTATTWTKGTDGGQTAQTGPHATTKEPESKPSGQESGDSQIPVEKIDIAIVGSEMEGMYLARAAADEGLKVKVIDTRDAPGGQLIQGEMLFLDETTDDKGKSLVQGRAKELFDGFKSGKIRKLQQFKDYYDNKLAKGIPIESGIRIESVAAKDGAVAGKQHASEAVYITKDGRKKRLQASVWVENTDHAGLVSHLTATKMPGLESVYGLPKPEYMAAGYMMHFKNVDWNKFLSHFNGLPSDEKKKWYGEAYINQTFAIALTDMVKKYKSSDDMVFLRGLNAVNLGDGEVSINALLVYDVDPSNPDSVAKALERGKKELPLVRDHFRKSMVGWEKAEIADYPNYLYIREFNHYETEYVLQVSDVLGGRMFPDNVSIAGYPLDLQGTTSNRWGISMGKPDKYGMPLRSFLLKRYDNVVMAGKNVGASAIAYGSARIQPNTALAAESIGVLLKQLGGAKTLDQVTDDDMKKLHETLAAKYGIKLTGIQATNKIAGWTEDEIAKLNSGKISYPSYARTKK